MNVDRQLGVQAAWRGLALCAVAISGTLLIGCSKQGDKPASQVAAKVNKEELTIHQINFVLEQQRGLAPDHVEPARKQALERLIDQELAVQKAAELKITRDPRVMQQIEAARREIIARTYFERVGNGAGKPTDAQVQKYFADNPALFAERRIYQLQEWSIEAAPDQIEALRAKAQASKLTSEFTDHLKAGNLKFQFNNVTRAAEQLPLASLPALSKLEDGQKLFNTRPGGLQVVALVSSRREPVELSRARPAIEQFLLNEQKNRLVADDLKALRAAAEIRYLNGFDGAAPSAASAPADQPAASSANPK